MELRSTLLAALFADLDQDSCLTVLDVGPALPETVEFFSQYRCRLFFADILGDGGLPCRGDEDDAADLEVLRDQYTGLINCPAQTRFDICLFWDLLNYLDEDGVAAFSWALHPYLTKRSRIHGFSTYKASTRLPHQQFAIAQTDHIKLRPREGTQPPRHLHPQAALKKLLFGLDVNKATLQPNGILELLLDVIDVPEHNLARGARRSTFA